MRTLLRILAFVLSSALLLAFAFSCGGQTDPDAGESSSNQETEDTSLSNESGAHSSRPEKQASVIFRMIVASDVHTSSATDTSANRLRKMFSSAYAYAGTQPYGTVDAAVFAGDLTNYGRVDEWNAFLQVSGEARKEETKQIAVMGNHEYYTGGRQAYLKTVSDRTNHHETVNGIHLIAISPDGDNVYSAETLSFLEEELAKAAEESPSMPIFVFQHHHIRNTVYVSAEWYAEDSAKLDTILKKYPQVIDFSGHSHAPVNHPGSVYQKDYTCVGTGTLAYFELLSGMTGGTIPPDASDAAQYWIVEVSDDGVTQLLPYNLLTDDFFRTLSTEDGDEQLIYEVSATAGKAGFLYTTEKRKEAQDVPEFGEADLWVGKETSGGATVTIPQARDADGIYSYRIVAEAKEKDNDAVKHEYACFSRFYIEPLPGSVDFTFSGLKPDTEYLVSVYPVDWLGNEGTPLTDVFRTLPKQQTEYRALQEVNYEGTFAHFDMTDELRLSSKTRAYGGTPDGDVFAGDWASGATGTGSSVRLSSDRGCRGSACLEVYSTISQNQGLYLFPNDNNLFSTDFKDPECLRVWVDFTEVDFRKANFGLLAPDGCLFTTDEKDGRSDLYFWYLPDGDEEDPDAEWTRFAHGDDGCFGTAQGSSVYGKKGWFAFPLSDMGYRWGTGSGSPESTDRYPSCRVAGVYLFWDYDKNASRNVLGKSFFLDEIHLVEDFRVFEPHLSN